MEIRDLHDLFLCHTCKSDPTIVTTFDYVHSADVTQRRSQDVMLRGWMEMFYTNTDQNCVKILETHVDLKQVSMSNVRKQQRESVQIWIICQILAK